MLRRNKEKLREQLASFTYGQIQDYMTIHAVMTEARISISDLRAYSKMRYQEWKRVEKLMKEARRIDGRCPECGEPVRVFELNLPKGRGNVHGWKTLTQCESCLYEHYSKDSVEKTLKKLEKDMEKANGNSNRRKRLRSLST